MTLYLLNTPVLTTYGRYRFEGPLTLEQARNLLQGGYISAIGHEGTAQLLSARLHQHVLCQRIAVRMQPGDQALVFRLTERLPEGRVLNTEELDTAHWEIGLMSRDS